MSRISVARRSGEAGVTFVELLVVMVIMAVVSVMLTTAVVAVSSNTRFNQDEATGLQDVRKVVERLGRDVRQARSIDNGATASELVLWVDANSDYLQQTDETIRWQLVESTSNSGHWDVIRSINGVTTYKQATTLVDQIAFGYSAEVGSDGTPVALTMPLSPTDAEKARVVSTSIRYDALLGRGTELRTVEFASRLRNVG